MGNGMVPAGRSGVSTIACRWLGIALMLLSAGAGAAQAESGGLSQLAIIIDDMGNTLGAGEAAVGLPGAVTYAFLPHTPYAARLAEQAHRLRKEIMLHLPMESSFGKRLGPGGLTLDMTESEFRRSLHSSLASVPYVAGVNNHMGSVLTRHPGAMRWLMQGMMAFGELYFIDSRTSVRTVAQQLAREEGLPSARRHVFLDNIPTTAAVRRQLQQLIGEARRHGAAIGIGHPYPQTLQVLREELPKLKAQGIALVSASELTKKYSRRNLWRESLSPLLKAAKNSKR